MKISARFQSLASRLKTEDFLETMRLHVRLDHPNIVTCFGVVWGQDTDAIGAGLLLEKLSHGDLQSALVADMQLPPSDRWLVWPLKLEILDKIGLALIYAHSFNVVHGNLSARHVLLAFPPLEVKLSGFKVDTSSQRPLNISPPEVLRGMILHDRKRDEKWAYIHR
jgi:hypothetical protein